MTFLWIVPLLFIVATNAMILDWNKLQVAANTSIFVVAPVFSLAAAPMGKEWPTVSYDISLSKTTNPTTKIRMYALLYSTEAMAGIGAPQIGANTPTGKVYCCTAELLAAKQCYVLGSFLINSASRENTALVNFQEFDIQGDPIKRNATLMVNSTSNYVFQLTTCDAEGFTLSGSATWKSAYGYLPGDYIMSLPFAGVMSLMLFTVLLVFSIFMIKHRSALIRIQWGIFIVCLVSLITSLAYFFYRLHNNNEGHYHIFSLVFVILIDMAKKTIARVLVLLLAMGYGVVKWTLGHIVMIKVALLALAYFVFTFILIYWQETSVLAQYNKQPLGWTNLAVVIPQALTETLFFYWVMLSLIRTIQQLILRRQDLKLQMYKTFLGVLAATGVLTLVMTLYVSFGLGDRSAYAVSTSTWRNRWLIDGTWDLLFFIVLIAICILWRPRKNNVRYGAESLSRGDDRIINTNEDDVAIPISEEFVYEGAGRRRTGAKKSEEIIGLAASKKGSNSDRDEYDNNREKSISVTGFKPEELSAFNQSILEIEIDEEDSKGVLDELSKID